MLTMPRTRPQRTARDRREGTTHLHARCSVVRLWRVPGLVSHQISESRSEFQSQASAAPSRRTTHMLSILRGLVLPAPSLVVVDLDFCLWRRPRFRSAQFAADGDGGVVSSCGKTLELYDGARRALIRLSDAGIPVAAVSRTHRKEWALEWLRLLIVDADRSAADVLACTVIRDGVKSLHVRLTELAALLVLY